MSEHCADPERRVSGAEAVPVKLAGDGGVLVRRQGPAIVITLNRPEVKNAVNGTGVATIAAALELADRDPEVWVVVLSGADGSFCAGADLREVADGRPPSRTPEGLRWGFAGFTRHRITKPTIAAVSGAAVGGGMELVLACDMAVADESAFFGLPEVSRGIIAAGGGAFRLPAQIPRKVAMELLLTGESIDAHRARELGLVNRVVREATELDAALDLADRICANAPLAVQASKRVATSVDPGTEPDLEHWVRLEQELTPLLNSADAREGAVAFIEKRHPRWRGS